VRARTQEAADQFVADAERLEAAGGGQRAAGHCLQRRPVTTWCGSRTPSGCSGSPVVSSQNGQGPHGRLSENATVPSIRFCMSCGEQLGLIAPCRCQRCGQEYWNNPKPCGGACIVDDGRLLLVRRAKDPGAGLWDLPGGFCDPSEHPEATARREVEEETGLTLHSMRFLGMWIDRYGNEEPPEITLNIYYVGRPHHPEQARLSEETVEVRWFSPGHIPLDSLAFAHVEEAIRCWSEGRAGD
jgi:8-oxo-dGTP diphosphatase